MAIVVVGGQSRNVGKTSVVEGLIRGLPEMRWMAIKVEPSGETGGPGVAVSEEKDGARRTDSSRYLAAGAVRSLWVRTRTDDLTDAMPLILKELEAAENVVIESNSILRFLQPDIYLSVLDPAGADFKESAKQYLRRADAVLVPEGVMGKPEWKSVSLKLAEGTQVLAMRPPEYVTGEILEFVRARIEYSFRTRV
jgi:hypothetical protein